MFLQIIAPEEICPPLRVGVSVKVGFRVGAFVNQTIVPEENCPWLLGLGFGVGGQFS